MGGARGGLIESFEFVRERAGVLGATGARTEADGPFNENGWNYLKITHT